MNRILLAGFDGRNNSARIIAERVKMPCRKLIFPCHNNKAAELLHNALKDKSIACVVMLGQKPAVRDKIAVEPNAVRNGNILHTAMDCTVTAEMLKAGGYDAYISKGCGNSCCNHIYYECLETGVNCIFLHVPTMCNISDISAITAAVEHYIEGVGGVPSTLLS